MMKLNKIIAVAAAAALLKIPIAAAAAEYPIDQMPDEHANEQMIEVNDETDDLTLGLNITKNGTYYLDKQGNRIKSKWLRVKDDHYYFDENGKALTGRNIINGMERTFNSKGQYLKSHVHTNYVNSKKLYDYENLTEDIEQLDRRYPEIFSYDSLGSTADGREVWHITIGDPEAEKQIVIVAACHGREYMTSLLVMDMTESLLNKYYTGTFHGKAYSELFSEYSVHIIPMLNPDGASISRHGINGINNPEVAAKVTQMYNNAVEWGYTDLSFEDALRRWKANAEGVDLNRNFDAKWEEIGSLNGPVPWNYKGSHPVSEAESQGITKFISSLTNPVTVVSYHATGSMLYWDYGQEGNLRARSVAQKDLIVSLTGYTALDYADSSAGGLSDWIFASGMDTVPQTIEIGKGAAPLPMSEYGSIWNKNKYVLPSLAELYSSDNVIDYEYPPLPQETAEEEETAEAPAETPLPAAEQPEQTEEQPAQTEQPEQSAEQPAQTDQTPSEGQAAETAANS